MLYQDPKIFSFPQVSITGSRKVLRGKHTFEFSFFIEIL